jgi:hypothetical protein
MISVNLQNFKFSLIVILHLSKANHQLLEDSIRNLEDHSKRINNFKLILETKEKKGYFQRFFSWS